MFGAMKVVGGTFGTSGYTWIRDGQRLDIRSNRKRVYSRDEIRRVDARVESERNFGCFSFVIGAVIFCGAGGFFLGPLGILIGLVLAVALSFYTTRRQIVEVLLNDDEKVILECSKWQVEDLISLPRR